MPKRKRKKNTLTERLHEKLNRSMSPGDFDLHLRPDPEVAGSVGSVSWYDFDGITEGDTVREQEIIDQWLAKFIAKNKTGYPIRIIKQADGNGHCQLWFRRA